MATHLSVRVPGELDTFLINDLGEPFDEITASSLLKLTLDGDAIGRTGCVDPDGVAIHRAAYAVRPDVHCAMHIRTLDGAGVALMRQGLRPSNQDVLFVLDDIVYHRYGMPGSAEEATALGESCRKGRFVVLNNNGLLSIAATAPAALRQLYTLQRTCEWEIDSRRRPELRRARPRAPWSSCTPETPRRSPTQRSNSRCAAPARTRC